MRIPSCVYTHLAYERLPWLPLVKRAMSLRIPHKQVGTSATETPPVSQGRNEVYYSLRFLFHTIMNVRDYIIMYLLNMQNYKAALFLT